MTFLNDLHATHYTENDDKRPAIATLHTDGRGYWSNIAKAVQITALTVPYINEDEDFGELCVHFNTDSWKPSEDGLIYTDKLFEQELLAYLESIGLGSADVGYSEQGMQGDNYVSLDVEEEFLAKWKAKYPEAYAATLED